jgi:IS1 family transposase
VRIELTLDRRDLEAVAALWQRAAGLDVEGTIEDRYLAYRTELASLSV